MIPVAQLNWCRGNRLARRAAGALSQVSLAVSRRARIVFWISDVPS